MPVHTVSNSYRNPNSLVYFIFPLPTKVFVFYRAIQILFIHFVLSHLTAGESYLLTRDVKPGDVASTSRARSRAV